MGTINDLNTTDTLADEDKFVIWKNSAQATRAITAENAATYFAGGGGPYQPLDELLTSIAALGPTSVADRMIYTTAQDVAALTPITAFGRSVLSLTAVADKMIYSSGANTAATTDITSFGRSLVALPDADALKALVGSTDEILLSDYPLTQAGFVQAVTDAVTAGKWLNGEELVVPLTSLMSIALTDELSWRNVYYSKPAQSSGDFEYAITINGPDFANVTTLGANAAIGATSITVSSDTNIVAGAKYLLISDTDYNPDPGGYGNAVAKKSEWIRVATSYVSGTTVPLQASLQSSYTTAANARIYRFPETAKVRFQNVKAIGGGEGEKQGGMRLNRCVIEQADLIQSEGNEYASFTYSLCGHNGAISAKVKDSSLAGYGYGLEFSGCDAPLVDWVDGENTRHVETLGSSFSTTLPFGGGTVVILGRGGSTGWVNGDNCVGSVQDVHTGHVGHNIGEVSGSMVGGNTQEAVTCESHAIKYGQVRVTGADLPITVLYYGHPTDEPSPQVTFGSADVGYGGTSSNVAFLAINRDAANRYTFHVHADVIEGRYPGGINATATEGAVYLTVDKANLYSRTTHTVSAVSSANGQAFITIQNPWIIEDSGNAAIYAIRADGGAYEAVNAGVFGAIVELGNGTVSADNTAYRADDAQIILNGTRGTSTQSLVGIGTVLTPGQIKSSVVEVGSAVSLTTDTATNITTLSLEPGVWRVAGGVSFRPNTTTSVTRLIASISVTSATLGGSSVVGESQNNLISAAYVPGQINITVDAGDAIMTLTAQTTVYLIARPTFTVSTMTGFGKIQAERIS